MGLRGMGLRVMGRRSAPKCALLVAALCGVGCGPIGPSEASPGAPRTIVGSVVFDARHPTPQGASESIEVRPARHVDLALLDRAGRVVAEGQTGADGRFALAGPGDAATLRVFARVRVRGHDVAIATDSNGGETHHLDVPLDPPARARTGEDEAPLEVHAVDLTGDAGALHVVDTLLLGLDTVQRWTGHTLPPVFAYWVRGGTREWSFYRGERPDGSGRFALELLGGDPGQASVTDTDEHDEAIVLHELGHFVMDRLTSDSSTGGTHPRGVGVDPGLAWEEGRATWFALSALGIPTYQDTIGVQPWGRLRVDEDIESGLDEVPGIGSESGVSKVLWDLADGAEGGPPDTDQDGIALGPAVLLRAMEAHAQEEGAYPSLSSFLAFLVRTGAVSRADLGAMLLRTGQPRAALLPDDGSIPWPIDVAVGAPVRGHIDGLSQPAPSGGPNIALTGLDAVHTYRVHVERAGMLVARLAIAGTGQTLDHTDLDLALLDLRADRLEDSSSQAATETVARFVRPGWYILRVRDGGGQGNRADYVLVTSVESL